MPDTMLRKSKALADLHGGTKPRILILDDVEELCDTLKDIFCMLGCEAEAAVTYDSFTNMFEGFKPDHILTDVFMPNRDATDIMNFLVKQEFSGKVYLMSGGDGSVVDTVSKLAVAKGLEIKSVLRKPIAVSDVKDIIAKHRSTQQSSDS